MIFLSSMKELKPALRRRVSVQPANPGGESFETLTHSNIMPGPDGQMIYVVGISQWVTLERVRFLDENLPSS